MVWCDGHDLMTMMLEWEKFGYWEWFFLLMGIEA